MEIKRIGSQPSGKGPAEYFTGTVRIDPLNSPPEPARVAMALVTFEPGARTAWHTHPLAKRSSLPLAAAGCSAKVKKNRKYIRGTSSILRPAKSTGTAQQQLPP